jgi:formylglycine-generating enzyme required for sulfatase activity
MKLSKHSLPFDLFIERLKHRGFTITPEHYIRLQILLRNTSPADDLEQVKLMLCPLFAASESQQTIFYAEFDHFFDALKPEIHPVQSDVASDVASQEIENDKTRKWSYWITGFILLCVSIFLIHRYSPLPDDPIKTEIMQTSPDREGTIHDEVINPAQFPNNVKDIPQQPEKPEPQIKEKKNQPINWRIPRYVFLIALALGILLSELYRYNHRKMVLQKQQKKKPPLTWPIKVPAQQPAYLRTTQFYETARRFRNRLLSDILRLDIPATIQKSLESCGFPIPQYSSLTRLPEYLFLIDLPDFRDHYAGYVSQIVDALGNENIFVKRFHYMDDPQICFESMQGERFFLDDLFHKFPAHRLIVAGTGDAFLHPLTGQAEPWVQTFHQWKTRALLTPRSISQWGMNERTLKAHFPLFPATMNGMDHLSLFFDFYEKSSTRPFDKPPQPLFLPDSVDPDVLKVTIDDDFLFQWVCACAVYPELHWNLTLTVGTRIQQAPVQEAQVLRLLQLPWFQKAVIPDQWRKALIQHLTPENKERTHQTIIDLLEKNPPPAHSSAADMYRLNLSIQKWMLRPRDKEARKTVKKNVIDQSRIAQEHTVLRMLDAAPESSLDFILPAYLRKLFFEHGLPLFGLKSGIRMLTAFCLSLFLVALAVLPDLPYLLDKDTLSEKPIFSLKSDRIVKDAQTTLVAMNEAARQKSPLYIKWDQYDLDAIPPDNMDAFQWTFNPFQRALPQEALLPGNHQISVSFNALAWSDALTIHIIKNKPVKNEPVEKEPVSKEPVKKESTTMVAEKKEMIETGRLFIQTIPENAQISILYQKQPYKPGIPLPAGTYTVDVSYTNYVSQTKKIRIEAGKDSIETIELLPFGTLTIQPEPEDARIRIMNIKPVYQDGIQLAPGRYQIEVSKDGFNTYLDWITLTAGEQKIVPIQLDAGMAQLTINVTPKDANIRLKNIKRKYSSGMMLQPGQYIVEISKKGFESNSFSITVAAGELKNMDVNLKKIGVPDPSNQIKVKVWTEPVTSMEFVWVPPGCFMMGQTESEKKQLIKEVGQSSYKSNYKDELPQHEVCVDGFFMGKYEVTVEQYMIFAKENPKHMPQWLEPGNEYNIEQGKNDLYKKFVEKKKYPVVGVSWNNAKEMSKWLSLKNRKRKFRLPTEAEWEYACRAGTKTPFYFGETITTDMANYHGNYPYGNAPKGIYREKTTLVGSFPPNKFGLFDMHGNVWEWCEDVYISDAYNNHAKQNPVVTDGGSDRVLRGGSWNYDARDLRSANRDRSNPGNRDGDTGFRLLEK